MERYEINRLLARLKYLGQVDQETNTDDLIYNLNVIIGFFNAVDHVGASDTIWRAEQFIKNMIDEKS